jgi:hypothetical protein
MSTPPRDRDVEPGGAIERADGDALAAVRLRAA